jgi:hypothetical protein
MDTLLLIMLTLSFILEISANKSHNTLTIHVVYSLPPNKYLKTGPDINIQSLINLSSSTITLSVQIKKSG